MMITLSTLLLGLLVIFCLVALLKAVLLLKQRLCYQNLLACFPGPVPHWWYGNTKQITGDYQGLLESVTYANQYGGIFPVWTGPCDVTLFSVHPSTAKTILAGMDPKDEFSYALLGPWLGNGLLLQNGKKWERNRRLLTPAFHVEMMKNYVDVFEQSVGELVSKWKKCHADGPFEVFHHASLLTMDSMLRCLFGHISHCQQEKSRHPYIQAVYEVSELIVKRLSKPHLMVDAIYNLTEDGKKFKKACSNIHAYSQGLITERRKVIDSKKLDRRNIDFLDVLLTAQDSDGQGLTDQEIQDEVDTFMFAGHDSTASSLSWCLYNLAAHPQCQEECRKEASKILARKEQFTWDDLKKLNMISACIQESMRLYPAVPVLSRFTEREIALPDGRIIPKGLRVAVSLFALHRNPELWHEPESFEPDRFLDGDIENQGSCHMPFSVGPRNCIGKVFAQTQLKLAVATIVSNFQLTVVPERPPIPQSSLILRSQNGLFLHIKPLKS